MAHQWRGVIREYADRLPVTESTRVITLGVIMLSKKKMSLMAAFLLFIVLQEAIGRGREPAALAPSIMAPALRPVHTYCRVLAAHLHELAAAVAAALVIAL